MQRVGGKLVHRGALFATREDVFRHDDGEVVERQIAVSAAASAVVAHDGENVLLIRQPREAVGEPSLLEIPAGKVDDGEEPLEAAKRELAEEIGRQAEDWRHLQSFYASPGFATEELHLYLATGLSEAEADADDEERIEIVEVPLTQLDGAISDCHDAKSLVGFLMLREILRES